MASFPQSSMSLGLRPSSDPTDLGGIRSWGSPQGVIAAGVNALLGMAIVASGEPRLMGVGLALLASAAIVRAAVWFRSFFAVSANQLRWRHLLKVHSILLEDIEEVKVSETSFVRRLAVSHNGRTSVLYPTRPRSVAEAVSQGGKVRVLTTDSPSTVAFGPILVIVVVLIVAVMTPLYSGLAPVSVQIESGLVRVSSGLYSSNLDLGDVSSVSLIDRIGPVKSRRGIAIGKSLTGQFDLARLGTGRVYTRGAGPYVLVAIRPSGFLIFEGETVDETRRLFVSIQSAVAERHPSVKD